MREDFYSGQCVLYRSDLDEIGYNSESVTDDTMQVICKSLNENMVRSIGEHWSMYYGNDTTEAAWWSQLMIICGIFEIERKRK